VRFTYMLKIYLNWLCSLPHSPMSIAPLLRTISTGFIFLFSYMDTKHIHQIHLHSSFPCAHPLPLISIPEKIYLPLLPFSFLNCVLIVQGGFTLVHQVCIYRALIKLTPSHLVTSSFSIAMLP
jgi:hypothetical protein